MIINTITQIQDKATNDKMKQNLKGEECKTNRRSKKKMKKE